MWKLHVLLLMVVMQTACSLGAPGKPARFYALSTHAGEPVRLRPAAQTLTIGVGPIALPDMFDRPQIVTRTGVNRVELGEFDRWGGNLGGDVQRTLAQNLADRLNSDNILAWPWQRRETPDLQVTVQFYRFDGTLGAEAYLSGIWQLLDAADECRLEVHRFTITRAPAGPDYPEFVSALSEALAQLSQDIAARISATRPGCRDLK